MLDEAKVAPVYLRLFTWLGLEAYGRFLSPCFSVGLHEVLERALAALIPLLPDLIEQLIAVEYALLDAPFRLGHKGIEYAGPFLSLLRWRVDRAIHDGSNRLAVMPGEAGDIADGHAFAVHVLRSFILALLGILPLAVTKPGWDLCEVTYYMIGS
jgi:hypothetical protein